MIYLTFIGNNDKITTAQPFGAALTIFLQYKDQLEQAYLFITPSKTGSDIYYSEIAKKTKTVMEQEKPNIRVQLVQIDLQNPIDFDIVYPVMLSETQKIMEDEQINKDIKLVWKYHAGKSEY